MGPGPAAAAALFVLTACGDGAVQCGPCPAPEQVHQRVTVDLARVAVDGSRYEVCAGDVGCWTVTLLVGPSGDLGCTPGPSGAGATCTAQRQGDEPDGAVVLAVGVPGPAEPLEDATVTARGLDADGRSASSSVDYEKASGPCSCGDDASAELTLR
ncbi:hypothetical protein [Phycicoccus flavus]|uniref:hypothetical protein n=1 Tax=Phycicoccus flavus TaxID=2502783 RepID=UPI000FEBCA44|nr:hypothetical protein [Phycicoccus flavus]NHA67250.1 hypothetical protein [Phycicoccus flavus]